MFGFGVPSIKVDRLAGRLEIPGSVLVDVREPDEFANGHVPGAVNIPLGQLPVRLGELDTQAETYVICQSGRRSSQAVRTMKKAGFNKAYNVTGGTSAWRGKLEK